MARIILSGTMVRMPLGGLNLWHLAWITGIKSLGHEIYFVERSLWEKSCYHVPKRVMTDDCSYGVSVVDKLLTQHGLGNNWCYVDHHKKHYGLSKSQLDYIFETADLFIDFEWGEWQEETVKIPIRVFVDGEPGWFQIKLYNMKAKNIPLPDYDFYFTNGISIGSNIAAVPTNGIKWQHVLPPAMIRHLPPQKPVKDGAFTTIMNWKSNKEVQYQGKTYGQKNMEFQKFMHLPTLISEKMEVAVSGSHVPKLELQANGWRLKNADDISSSGPSYMDYIIHSKGEFSVAKNVFVETKCGWFGDRGVYFMACNKPVVLQETGWSDYLPTGEGLFAFSNMHEAVNALDSVNNNYEEHCNKAREIAFDHFEAGHVMKSFLGKIGL